MLVLNSNAADGKDVSWIWDVDFESKVNDLPSNIFVSGQRYGDMMLRDLFGKDRRRLRFSQLCDYFAEGGPVGMP